MKRVMLADDEQNVRTALQKLIPWEEMGCQVVAAAGSGTEVLKLLDTCKPELLIVDIKMPGADGIEVARKIYEEGRNIAVIVLTAYAEFEYACQAMRYGVSEYIVKTAVLEQLPDAVRRTCGRMDAEEKKISTQSRQEFLSALLKGIVQTNNLPREMEPVFRQYQKGEPKFCLVLMHDTSGKLAPLLEQAFGSWNHTVVILDAVESCVLLSDELPSQQEIKGCCDSLVSLSNGFYQSRVMFGISNVFREIGEIRAAAVACQGLTDELFYEDARPVLFVSQERRKKDFSANLFESLDVLLERISHVDLEGAEEALNRFLEDCEKEDINTIKSAGIFLLTKCMRLLLERNPSFPRTFIDVEIQNNIYGCETITRFREVMEELLEQVIIIMAGGQQDTDDLIRQVNGYIDAHFQSRISLVHMADSLHINKSYLSRIYKEKTGKNIFDVINARKLEEAKRLIRHTELRLSEIAEQVGIDDPAYFSRFFKRHMGMSPKEYKQKVCGRGDGL